MTNRNTCVLGVLVLGAVSLALHAQATSPAPVAPAKKAAPSQAPQQNEGERVFAQNCSRCHTSPDGFSSHISGTITMHMRVRASLSQRDAKELFRFLNP